MVGGMSVRLTTSRPEGDFQHCYTVFWTGWGWAALACRGDTVVRFVLPGSDRSAVEEAVREGSGNLEQRDGHLRALRGAIVDYFAGRLPDFDCAIDISWASSFGAEVLRQCCELRLGERISYGELAARVSSAGAGRAVGAVMAANRAPLLIPCHRVVRADGSVGGFSARGGAGFKKRLLRHETELVGEAVRV